MKKRPAVLQLLVSLCLVGCIVGQLYIGMFLTSSLFAFSYATSVVENKKGNIAFVIGPGVPSIYLTQGSAKFSAIQEVSLMGLQSLWFAGLTPFLSWEGHGNISLGPLRFTTGARYRLEMKNMNAEAVQMDSLNGMVSFIRPANPAEILGTVRFPFFASVFCFGAINLAILEMLRRMLRKVQQGDAFTRASVRGVQAIGVLFILSGILQPLATGWFISEIAAYATNHLTTGILFDTRSILNYPVIFTGAVILALAEIFRQGVALKEDNTLTI